MSERVLKIGVIGLVHDHVWWNMDALAAFPGTEIAALVDVHPELMRKGLDRYGSGLRTYTDRAEFWAGEQGLDAVLVCESNRGKVSPIVEAAGRGLHVITEKPMADRLVSATEMEAVCRRAGVKLMINWPAAWAAGLWRAYELAKAGEIGAVYQVLFRCAHRGPREEGCSDYFCDWLFDNRRNGRGALTDYCSYGAAFCSLLLGRPERVAGAAGRLLKPEPGVIDNAVLVLQYEGAICVLEACWTQAVQDSHPIVIRGAEGALVPMDGPGGARLLKYDTGHPEGVELAVPALPEERRCMASMFYHHVVNGRPLYGICSPEVSLRAQEIMEWGAVGAIGGADLAGEG